MRLARRIFHPGQRGEESGCRKGDELGKALRKGWSMPLCLRLWSHSRMEVGHVQADGFLGPPRDPSCPFPFLVAKAGTEIALDK